MVRISLIQKCILYLGFGRPSSNCCLLNTSPLSGQRTHAALGIGTDQDILHISPTASFPLVPSVIWNLKHGAPWGTRRPPRASVDPVHIQCMYVHQSTIRIQNTRALCVVICSVLVGA